MAAAVPKLEPRPRIVIAEPDGDTRDLYTEALRSHAVDVVGVSDGRDALVQCFLRLPALVITDTWLPSLDGYALCEILRRDPLTSAIPLIVTTAEAGPNELLRLRRIPRALILQKPVALETLVARVADLDTPPPVEWEADVVAMDDGPHSIFMSTASRRFRRFVTTVPAEAPPVLRCPQCDRTLQFKQSRIGGVSHTDREQWDEFQCAACSAGFEYRHRTRKLKPIA